MTSDQVAAQIAQNQGMFQMQAQGSYLATDLIRRGQDPQYGSPLLAGKAFNTIGAVGAPLGGLAMGLAGLDPMSLGYTAFSGARGLGMGYMAAGGAALGTFGVATAGMMAAGYVASQMQAGAAQQQQFVRGMQGSFNFQTPFGSGFSNPQLAAIGGQLRNMSGQIGPQGQMVGFEELSALAQSMGKMGMTSGVQSVTSFTQSFRKMIDSVRHVAKELGTSLKEAQEMMAGMRNSGIFNVSDQQRMASEMRRFSVAGGLSTPELSQAASIGAQVSRAIGGKGGAGAFGGVRTLGQIGLAVESGVLSDEDIYNTTGLRGADGRQALASMQMQSAGAWLRTGRGRRFVASLADTNGELDPQAIRDWQSGKMGVGKTMETAYRNLGTVGRANFIRNEGRIRGEAFAAFGGNIPAMALSQWAESKRIDIQDMDDRSMIFAQRQLGMDRDMIDSAVKLINGMPEMARQQKRANSLDRQRTEVAEFRRTSGFEGARRKFEETREHIQNKLQGVGQQAYNELVKEIDSYLQNRAGIILNDVSQDIDKTYDAIIAGKGGKAARNRFGMGLKVQDSFKGAFSGKPSGMTAKQFTAGGFFGLGSSMEDKMKGAGYGSLFDQSGVDKTTVVTAMNSYDVIKKFSTDQDVQTGIARASAFMEGVTGPGSSKVAAMAKEQQDTLNEIYAKAGSKKGEDRRAFVESELRKMNVSGTNALADLLKVDRNDAKSYTAAGANLASMEEGIGLNSDMRVGAGGLPAGLRLMGGGRTDAEIQRAAGGGQGFLDTFLKGYGFDRSKSLRENLTPTSAKDAGRKLMAVASIASPAFGIGTALANVYKSLGDTAKADQAGAYNLSEQGMSEALDVMEGRDMRSMYKKRIANMKEDDPLRENAQKMLKLNELTLRAAKGEKINLEDHGLKDFAGTISAAIADKHKANFAVEQKRRTEEAKERLQNLTAVGYIGPDGKLSSDAAKALGAKGAELQALKIQQLESVRDAKSGADLTGIDAQGAVIAGKLNDLSVAELRQIGKGALSMGDAEGGTYLERAKALERNARAASRGNTGIATALGIKLGRSDYIALRGMKSGDGKLAKFLMGKLGISENGGMTQEQYEKAIADVEKNYTSEGMRAVEREKVEAQWKAAQDDRALAKSVKDLDSGKGDAAKKMLDLQTNPDVQRRLAEQKGQEDPSTRHLTSIAKDMARTVTLLGSLPADLASKMNKASSPATPAPGAGVSTGGSGASGGDYLAFRINMALLPPATEFDPYQGAEVPDLTTELNVSLLPEDARLGREEVLTRFSVNGRMMALYQRNKVGFTDWLHATAVATAHSIASNEEYRGTSPDRAVRDALLKTDEVI